MVSDGDVGCDLWLVRVDGGAGGGEVRYILVWFRAKHISNYDDLSYCF